eukprot:PLAT8804.1.p2 GENE.PLAT8804.1~~PLAT8804.1.p2  ORF type:complete len:109 (+),score=38.23 PLAT8804.1:41-328(+)
MAESKESRGETVVEQSDMPPDMQAFALEHTRAALSAYPIEKDVATAVKKAFDEKWGGTWHCIVGRTFGCAITHETKYLIFFKVGQVNVLLFKSME